MTLPRWVDAAEAVDASSSSDEEDEHEIDPTLERQVLERLQGDIDLTPSTSAPAPPKKGKLSIKVGGGGGGGLRCHVCGEAGHAAGFLGGGGVYVDCVNKPCYLCGVAGHSTATCPHRLAPEMACTAAADAGTGSFARHLFRREVQGRAAASHSLPPRPGAWAVDAAVLKLHARRATCLEFHPSADHLVLSGDKHGQIAVWDVDKVIERTVHTNLNKWLTNALRFLPGGGAGGSQVATASYDGTVKIVDVEIGAQVATLADANPGAGWVRVEEEDKAGRWVSFIGLDVAPGAVVAGDSKGKVYWLDPRAAAPAAALQVHKKGSKVQSVAVNPAAEAVVLTAGNDYQARLLDARMLGGGATTGTAAALPCAAEVAAFAHPRVVNAAYFSPVTGRKILTTAQDNRLRVWDGFGAAPGGPPDREIVHSHTFNRHLTAFRAEWDPKDASERLVAVGRYISEDYGGTPLHPVDLIDAATGALVGELADPNLTTICPVNKFHPRRDVIVTGSSRSLYAWRPAEEEAEGEGEGGLRAEDAEAAAAAAVQRFMVGEGAGGGGGGGRGGFVPRGSKHYMFFDADEGGGGKKKRAAKTVTAGAGGKTKQQRWGSGAGGSRGSGQQQGEKEEEEGGEDAE